MFCISDTMDRGEMWSELWLLVNGERVFRFGSGYLSSQTAISWPSQINETEQPARGFFTRQAGSDPAAGAEASIDSVTNRTWLLKAFHVTLTTSATVANRNVHLVIDPYGNNDNLNFFGNVVQAAGTTIKYTFAPVGYLPTAADANNIIVPIPPDVVIREGATPALSTSTTNLQAGDNFGAPVAIVEAFMVA